MNFQSDYKEIFGKDALVSSTDGVHGVLIEYFSRDYVKWLEVELEMAGNQIAAQTTSCIMYSEALLALHHFYIESTDKSSLPNFEAFCKQHIKKEIEEIRASKPNK